MKSTDIKRQRHFALFIAAAVRAAFIAFCLCAIFLMPLPAKATDETPACSPDGKRETYITAGVDKLTIGNANAERSIGISNGRAMPSTILNKIAGKKIVSAEEFSFTFYGGENVSSAEFAYAGRIPQEFDGGRCKLTVSFTSKELGIDAQVIFWVVPNSNLIRKYVRLRSADGRPVYVNGITVEHFKPAAAASIGGLGQPVFIGGNAFAGLEFPAGYNIVESDGGVTIAHYPGWELGQEWKKSKTAVTGFSAEGEASVSFKDYVKAIAVKPRPFTSFNSGGATGGFSIPACGNRVCPDCTDTDGGAGDVKSYCFSTHVFDALSARVEFIKDAIDKRDAKYFKHDFNRACCDGSGNALEFGEMTTLEAIADDEIRMLEAARAAKADVFLNISATAWPSPWWLPYTDSASIEAGDSALNEVVPAESNAERAGNYYDATLFGLLGRAKAQFPLWAIMTPETGDETTGKSKTGVSGLFSWADNSMLMFGRGSMMRAIDNPANNDVEMSSALSAGIGMDRWANSRAEAFANGEMKGGDPARGETYWFHFYDGASDILTIRTPDFAPSNIMTQLRPGNFVRMTYPYHEWISQSYAGDSGQIDVDLPGRSVVVLESFPPSLAPRPSIIGARSKIVRQTETETEYEVAGLPGRIAFKIRTPLRVDEVSLNGKAITPGDRGYYFGELEDERGTIPNPVDVSATAAKDDAGVTITAASEVTHDMVDTKRSILVESSAPAAPTRALIDGAAVDAVTSGKGWSVFTLPIGYGSETKRISFTADTMASTPFATDSFTVSVMSSGYFKGVKGRIIIKHEAAAQDTTILPPSPAQDYIKFFKPELVRQEFSLAEAMESRRFPSDAGFVPVAAKVRAGLFGSSPDDKCSIAVNGVNIAQLPVNDYPRERWQDFIIDAPEGALKSIHKDNLAIVSCESGAKMKFSGLAISAQLKDGTWVNTQIDGAAQYTGAGWVYAEGAGFNGDSKPTALDFP